MAPVVAQAAEFTASPSLRISSEFNTNRLVSTRDQPSVYGGNVETGLALTGRTERTSISVTPRLRAYRFTGNQGLDSNDVLIDVDARHAVTERLSSTLVFGFIRDSTTTSEFETNELVFRNSKRTQKVVSPNLSYALDDRNVVSLGGSIVSVDYEDAQRSGFSPYTNTSINGAIQHNLSEKDFISFSAFGSFYRPDLEVSQSDNAGVRLTYQRTWSDTLTTTAGIGGQYTKSTFQDLQPVFFFGPFVFFQRVNVDETQFGVLADASIQKRWEHYDASMTFSQDVSPSGRGSQASTQQLTGSLTHRYSDRLSAGASFSYSTQSFDGPQQVFNRDRYGVSTTVNWTLAEYWRLSAGYSYTTSTTGTGGDSGESHQITLNVNYGGDRWTVSN